ncbi:MAG TPA: ATP-binding protein [candidate division Zixibacteria bacterium]|nr:ATP-binding protein [candidate division Zixibacteria bacterium]
MVEAGPDPADSAGLRNAEPPRELTPEQLRFRVKLDESFSTTEDVVSLEDFAGQNRALAALELGLGLSGRGYNVFVSGLTGVENLRALQEWIAERSAQRETPGDWVYVHNFKHADAPRAIYLRAGQGSALKRKMHELVRTLREELPKAFRQEAFDKEKAQLREKYNRRAQEINAAFERLAREKGFVVQAGPGGQIFFIPIIGGKPMESPEEFARLSPAEQEEIGRRQQELAAEMERFGRRQQEVIRELEADIRLVERRFCENLLEPLLREIEAAMANEEVATYLKEVKSHILDHLDDFKEAERPVPFMPFAAPPRERDPFLEYEVNVVVDNAETRGAPVLVETSPTYLNLFGTIERVVDRFGRLVTNFTRIRSGSLLRAHGGYLIFSLDDAITEPAVWKVLKRTLKSGRIEIETYEPFALFSTSGLKPEPVSIDTKVIAVGSSFLYYLLYTYDEEFRETFKLRADFRGTMELEETHLQTYPRWVAKICREEKLPHFDRGAVERMIEFGARRAEDREKISAVYAEIADVVREAAFWARQEGARLVAARHVQRALENRVFRSNRIEEEIRELIAKGTILIDIDGKKVGQVNGLSVLELGGYAFGRPSRVTASVAMGQSGLINIERESRLSGSIHDKGVLILAGYLRNRYGQDKPLTISASICFEQSYAGVEGDSASSTELYALLSRLANIPLRQDIAVTGSVNQWGQVQAIGGVNEKIEGFFDVCRVMGLTGRQGVMIPEANCRNLLLRADVIEAVEQGRFHIYPVRTIDEGIELLSGVRAGMPDEEGTFNGEVNRRLRELASGLKAFVGEAQAKSPDSGLDNQKPG